MWFSFSIGRLVINRKHRGINAIGNYRFQLTIRQKPLLSFLSVEIGFLGAYIIDLEIRSERKLQNYSTLSVR